MRAFFPVPSTSNHTFTPGMWHSNILFPTRDMEREQRSLGSGSVSSREFQKCTWEGLQELVDEDHTRLGESPRGARLVANLKFDTPLWRP